MLYEGDIDSLEKRFVNDNTEYYLPDGLSPVCVFRIPTKVPEEFQMTQEDWEHGQKLCLESRLHGLCWKDEFKGQSWGGDILDPVLL